MKNKDFTRSVDYFNNMLKVYTMEVETIFQKLEDNIKNLKEELGVKEYEKTSYRYR